MIPFQLAGLIDGPLRSAAPARLDISAERLAWDSIELQADGDGVVAPGSSLPVSVGLNILSTEVSRVRVEVEAELRDRGSPQPLWRQEVEQIIETNALIPASTILPVRVPENAREGIHDLEVRVRWSPVESDSPPRQGLGLGRLIRRRKPMSGAGEATRRTSLLVLSESPGSKDRAPGAVGSTAGATSATEVDAFDFSRPRGSRPSTSGKTPTLSIIGRNWRVPEEALVEETRRDRLRGWIPRAPGEPIVLPPADSRGLPWTAVGLVTPHPERPHRLTLRVLGEAPRNLAVGLVGSSGGRSSVVLDVVASSTTARSPANAAGREAASVHSWVVWPGSSDPVLILVNRDGDRPVRPEAITVEELSDLEAGDGVGPNASGPRWLALDVNEHVFLRRFGGLDAWSSSWNLGLYARYSGANAVVLGDRLSDREARRSLQGQAVPDTLGPDRLDVALRALDRQGLAAWVNLDLDGRLPGLPAPETPEARAEGLLRLDRGGRPDGPPTYNAIDPRVREGIARKAAAAVSYKKDRANLAGAVIALGQGTTLLGRADSGLDDATFTRFVNETFAPGLARGIPGMSLEDPNRFSIRAAYVEQQGRLPWTAWRAKQVASLHQEISTAVRRAAPGAVLAVVTPMLEEGPVGEETRRLDLVGLGAEQAWRSVGLDLSVWPDGGEGPIVWRGVTPGEPGELEHDLSTSPELDEPLTSRIKRGMLFTDPDRVSRRSIPSMTPRDRDLSLSARAGATGDELTTHALAKLDSRWIILTPDAVAGREDRVRRFGRLFTSLPAARDSSRTSSIASGVAVRAEPVAGRDATVVVFANDTPYDVLVESHLKAPPGARVVDRSRNVGLAPEDVGGARRVVLAIEPFGVSVLEIGAENVSIESARVHPGPGVLDELRIRSDVISATLARLNRAGNDGGRSGPADSDFEPDSERDLEGVGSWPAPSTWVAAEGTVLEIDATRPHRGRGSLKAKSRDRAAEVASEAFSPVGRPNLTIATWFRVEHPDARLRISLEGQAAGKPFSRGIEVAGSTEWRELSLLAASIPGGGLDSARLRFQLVEPGSFWIDAVSVTGSPLTEPQRLNARRDLLAALSAYHEGRYGDFARLSGSHWAHQVSADIERGILDEAPSALADRSGLIRTAEPAGSALPTPRRLR
ncbi:MAG: hypothetical protein SFX72_19440 [Isosphaeraceae bacterium]|nr:hypothetical protein [Isosphaeraceae bacterium]